MNEELKCKELYEALDKACRSVTELIGFSHGVDGLHMNGDVAPWDDLRSGGRYEGWLIEFDEALEVLNKYAEEVGDESENEDLLFSMEEIVEANTDLEDVLNKLEKTERKVVKCVNCAFILNVVK